ncbi:MAG TPA: ClpXP protease specificity-enhancing factor SspB [Alphaproteobacteria bacterium]|mgnify:CR=1 FL=1|nr:ClpXP protease specificity-enhancing factor SspB [Alphaproteobacteria bacterium]
MKKAEEMLRYDKMVEGALRGVVRQAVEEVVASGLPGDHHFYITFMTDYPGVEIPAYLRERYPGEMTIVLQYQFYDLKVDREKMSVTLSFNNVPERLVIPLAAVSIFADPSVNFALQFQPMGDGDEGDDTDGTPDGSGGGSGGAKPKKSDQTTGEVVSLDQFRKK